MCMSEALRFSVDTSSGPPLAQLVASTNSWTEPHLRWRLRATSGARRGQTACCLDGEGAGKQRTGKIKGKGSAGGHGKGKGYGADRGYKGCAGGKATLAEEALVGDGHQNIRAACINLGGWRKRIRYVYTWNMWNMPAAIILCCEVDVVTYEQMTQEVQKLEEADSAEVVQLPPQGSAEEGFVHRWVASPLLRGCAVSGLAHRVAKLTPYYPYEREQGGS